MASFAMSSREMARAISLCGSTGAAGFMEACVGDSASTRLARFSPGEARYPHALGLKHDEGGLHPRAFALHCIEHSLGQFRSQPGRISDEDDAARFLAGG